MLRPIAAFSSGEAIQYPYFAATSNSSCISSGVRGAGLLVEIAKNKDLVAILAALRGVGALTNKLEVDSSTANEQRSYAFPKVAFFYKHGRWPTLPEAIEFDKTLDVEPLIKASAE